MAEILQGKSLFPAGMIVLLILALIPLFRPGAAVFNVLILANLTALLVAAWDFMAGYSGQVSAGHALGFGAGAYTLAVATTVAGVTPWMALPLATGVGAAIMALAGTVCVRITGPYFILATLALAEIAHEVALSWGMKLPGGYLIGGEGGIPIRPLFPATLPYYYELNFYLSLFLMLAGVILLVRIGQSRLGLKLRAVGDDVQSADSIGLDPFRYRWAAFSISGGLATAAGAFQGQYLHLATPSTLSVELSFAVMAMAVIGGRGTILGAATGAYLLTVLFNLIWAPPVWRMVIYSLLLLLVARFFPQGVLAGIKVRQDEQPVPAGD